jgi:pyruvate kinase
MDLRGRQIRTSAFEDPEGAQYNHGQVFEIRTDGFDIPSTKEEVQINYFDLPPVMREGDQVIFGDNGYL